MANLMSERRTLLSINRDYIENLSENIAGLSTDNKLKEKIKRFFLVTVTNYLQNLVALEMEIEAAPSDNGFRNNGLGKKFTALTTNVIDRGEKILKNVDNKTLKEGVKQAFRKGLEPWIAGNPFIRRCLEKPRGYPGDYLMMELGYVNEPKTTGGLSGFFDRYFINYYRPVARRKDKIKQIIVKRLKQETRSNRCLNVLSLGCGPCREWFELGKELSDRKFVKRINLKCLDNDEEALEFARERLERNPLLHSVKYLRKDLFAFGREAKRQEPKENFDLIYGLGLANYFYDHTLSIIVGGSLLLLRKGGEFVITHKDRKHFKFPVADWLCDWAFIQRTEQEFAKLLKNTVREAQGHFEVRLVDRQEGGEFMFGVAKRSD